MNQAGPFDFSGRAIVVMGGDDPVARAIALAFAEAGADLAVTTATNDAEAALAMRRLAQQAGGEGRKTLSEMVDMSIGANVQVALRQIAKELGAIDVLVTATNLDIEKAAERISDAEWSRIVNQNLSATFYACRGAAREMLGRTLPPERENSRGRIIVVTGVEGRGSAVHQATKAGVQVLVRGLAAEWRPQGLTVNGIAASGTGASGAAALALWLASDGGGGVTGQTFKVGDAPPEAASGIVADASPI